MTDQTNQAEADAAALADALYQRTAERDELTKELYKRTQRQREVYKDLSQVLTQRLDIAHRQRDELASCLREVLDMIKTGALVLSPGQLLGNAFQYITLANRIQGVLLRIEVRERLDERLEAERKEEA